MTQNTDPRTEPVARELKKRDTVVTDADDNR